MHGPSHGEIFFDAKNTASCLPRASSWRYEDLRRSTRNLWEAAAIAAIETDPVAWRADLGEVSYEAWLEATGLPVNHFMRWKDLGESAKLEWRWAASTVRRRAGLRTA